MNKPPDQPPEQNLNITESVLESVQIGGIAGRDLNLTQVQGGVGEINVFGTVQVSQAPSNAAKSLNKQEYRWRRVLLDQVKKFWVEGVLNKSLYNQVLIELGLEERRNFVQKPLSGVEEFADDEVKNFPSGTTASKIFEDIGAGRTLLILGEPGSGKTVTLLKLVESLIARSENDLSQPFPVVVNLSSWAKKRNSISDWLVQELKDIYGVNKAVGKTWVDQEQLILLLDGLDEVDSQYRNDCVKALNGFIDTHGLTEIVVCCRIRDYEVLSERLKLRSAIYVRSLTTDQIDHFFERAGESLIALKELIKQNTEFQELASLPLMLSIMSLTYQDFPNEAIPQAGNQLKHLLDTYIDRMFQRRGTTKKYTRKQTLHWLTFLGRQMVQSSQTIFLIEELQPSCLRQNPKGLYIYRWIVGLSLGLIAGLIFGLIFELIFGLRLGLSDVLIAVLIGGLIAGLIGGLGVGLGDSISIKDKITFSFSKFKQGLSGGLIGGLMFGLSYGLRLGLNVGLISWTSEILISGLMFGLMFGLISGLNSGLTVDVVEAKRVPNQGVWNSFRNFIKVMMISVLTFVMIISMLIFGLIAGLIFGLSDVLIGGLSVGLNSMLIFGLISMLIFGLSVGLSVGLVEVIQHVALRIALNETGYIPWNYAKFLDSATDRLFLQKVGGGYIFYHRMLLEHFAAMELDRPD